MHRLLPPLSMLAVSGLLSAQMAILPPACALGLEGSSSTGTLWSSTGTALRQQMIYARTSLPQGALTITRLYWRANGNAAATAGGTYASVTINMCTSATPYTAPSSTFASNLGGDLVNVYSGPVTVQPAPQALPGLWYVDVPLTVPFVYTAQGDLLIEVNWPSGGWTGGTVTTTDYHIPAGTPAARVYSTTAGSATGAVNSSAGIVVGFDYVADPNSATFNRYGQGCYDSTIYEFWSPAAVFDLSNTALRLAPNTMGGYTVTSIPANVIAPTSVPFPGADDGISPAQTLPFTFFFPGGSTTQIRISTNGFLWLDGTSSSSDFSPTPTELLTLLPRLAPAWTDWNCSTTSTSGNGTYHFDIDPSNNFVYATWLGIGAFGITSTYGGPSASTFQCQMYVDGTIEYHYGTVYNAYTFREMLVGIKPGPGTYADPGSKDLSGLATLPAFSTVSGMVAGLRHAASARPVLGTTIALDSSNIPPGAAFTATVLSFAAQVPPLELGFLGMPACDQNIGLASSSVLGINFGSPSVSRSLTLPAIAALSGLPGFSQSVAFVLGVNAFGALTSNGVGLTLGTL